MDAAGKGGARSRAIGSRAPLSRRQVLRGVAALGGGALLSSLLAACGGPGATATSGTSRPAAGGPATPAFNRQASITLWNFGVEETNPLAFARVEAFKKQYPGITLEIVPKADDQKLLTAAAAKQLPDILWLERESTSSWAARGVLQPIDDLIARDKYDTGRFYEAAFSESRYDNKTWGLPQFMPVRALYVNLDMLKEAGADLATLDTGNWEQFTELGRALTRRSGDRVDRWGFANKIQDFLWLYGLANGGTFISPDGKRAGFNDPKIVDALDWGIKNYEAQGGYKSYQALATTFQNDEQFARGQVAMTPYENFMLGIIARVAPGLNFALVPMRKRGGGPNDWISFTGGNIWTIPSGAKDRDAAWEFIKFMSAEETWLLGANATKDVRKKANQPYIPTLTANKMADRQTVERVYESSGAPFDNAVRLLPQLLERSQKIPLTVSPVSKQLSDLLSNEGIKPALSGERSAKEALDRANQRAQQEIDAFKPS